jgi:hypothetical protein
VPENIQFSFLHSLTAQFNLKCMGPFRVYGALKVSPKRKHSRNYTLSQPRYRYININLLRIYFSIRHYGPNRAMVSSFFRSLDHTQPRTTVGRTPSGRMISSSLRPLSDNTQKSKQTSRPSAEFEPTISADERTQTYVVCPKSKCTDFPMYELAT